MADWIPTSEQGLIALCERWLKLLQEVENIGKYHFDQNECDMAIPKIKAFTTAWAKFEDDDSSTNRVLKNDAKKEVMAAMRRFAKTSIRYNNYMDNGLKEALGIPEPDSIRTAHPRPTSQPHTVAELTGNHFEHRVKALRHEGRQGTKPPDAYGVRFAWQVDGVKPASGEDLPKTRFSRKVVQTFTFTEAGMVCHLLRERQG